MMLPEVCYAQTSMMSLQSMHTSGFDNVTVGKFDAKTLKQDKSNVSDVTSLVKQKNKKKRAFKT